MAREKNDPVPQQEQFGSGQPKLADVYRPSDESLDRQQLKLMKSHFDQQEKKLDKLMDNITRLLDQYVASLEHDAWQPRLAMEADGPANIKTHERTEGATTAVQAMHGDSCSADWVDPDPMCSTSFGDDSTGPSAPPCSGEKALVDNGAAAPKSFLLSLEMRSPTAAGDLLAAGEASTTSKITFNQSPFRLYSAEETNLKTSPIPYASYDSSFFQKSNLPAALSYRRVIET